MHLLAFHALASAGDGLAPEMVTLLASRHAIATDPKIVLLSSFNRATPNVARGPIRTAPVSKTIAETANGTPEPVSSASPDEPT